ncbi:hypothetical protein [Streptomyces sp. NPDC001137]|uniref:hypothetical protein n=1 Tax=Streptomyces sp. NPDC001137 TaxID=3154378 RepID=UPI00331D4442
MGTVDVLVGVGGTVIGGVLGHVLALRQQSLIWRREDRRLVQQREHAERIDFGVEVRFVSVHGDTWLVELAAMLDNKGQVQYATSHLTFELRCVYPEDPLITGADIGGQVLIPHVLITGSWLPQGWVATLIEPGLTTRYSFVASVPRSATAVLLHGAFRYRAGNDASHHTAESFHAVPESPGSE